MYTSISCHIVDCSEFIWGMYTDIVCLDLHMNLLHMWHISAIWGHICCWHIYDNSMVKRSCSLLLFFTYMCSLYADYGSSAVGHTYVVTGIHVYSHIPIMWNILIAVLMVILLITLSPCEVLYWQLCHMCTWTSLCLWCICGIWKAYLLHAHTGK